MNPPAITIGIMTHNYGRYIRAAIESVLAQDRSDWEMVISDDASTDDTEEIVRPYLNDTRITYVRHNANLGQAGNWAFLLQQGTAPLMAVLHADDSYVPNILDKQIKYFESDPELDLLYGNWWRVTEFVDENARERGKTEKAHVFTGFEEYRYQIEHNSWLVSGSVLTRRVVEAAGLPDTSLKMIVDYEYMSRVALKARKVRCIEDPTFIYRIHKGSTTDVSANNGVFMDEVQQLVPLGIKATEGLPELADSHDRWRRLSARTLFSDGVTKLLYGNIELGKYRIKQAVGIYPRLLMEPIAFVDYVLCVTGLFRTVIFRKLHKNRLNA